MEELGEAAYEIANIEEMHLRADDPTADYAEIFKNFVTETNDVTACIELLIEHGLLVNQPFEEGELERAINKDLFSDSRTTGSILTTKYMDAQKAISKMLRFGLGHRHPAFCIPGIAVLTNCLLGLFANIRSLQTKHKLDGLYDQDAIKAKKEKVFKYLNMAIAEGRVTAIDDLEKQ